ncbi:MAG: aminomethyl-transferring glycine dehydrogenase subunit GcvPA [Lentisphaeria bacterium]|nr:aminomethyl-transferring glycine dehydrogenase subunit GcvPA [Lentisphaeria bacterium]NQZ69328.1 aminomethyl-transferring glycine dehydrogenase subunit GcvPA [Lentisphaeria bacterium]
MPYIANTDTDRGVMLKSIGVADIDELWASAGISTPKPELSSIAEGKSEYEVIQYLSKLADRNAHDLTCFLGSGFYDHFIPSVVGEITGRGEFYTAYTPYQPEASQGTLQAMYEYQSNICRLTGMDVANASLYDGGTALFEGMMMGLRVNKKRDKVVMAGTVSPIYREMIKCYSQNLDINLNISPVPDDDTATNLNEFKAMLDDDTAVMLVQYPNVFGTVEDWTDMVSYAHEKGIICVCSSYPIALSLCKSPGEMGFDVACGEGQSLGIPLSFGGPYLGFIACKPKQMRQMPGRIVGRTVDMDEKDAYVLTLQAREQHIRRDKATSNICTNEGLCALAATVYFAAIGKEGFIELGKLCSAKASFAREQLLQIDGVEPVGQAHFFNEFVVRLPMDAGELVGRMIDKGFAAGFPLGRYYEERKNDLLIAVTEKRSKEEIKAFAVALEACLY